MFPPPPLPLAEMVNVVVETFLRVTVSPAASATMPCIPMSFALPPPVPCVTAVCTVPFTVIARVPLDPAVETPQLTRYDPDAGTVIVVFGLSVTFVSRLGPSNATLALSARA